MKRFAKLLVVTLSFGALGFVMSLVPQKSATGAAGAPVNIVSSVPLSVTGNVNAAVTGTVAAQQSGNWNVGITGTPSVGIQNVNNASGLPIPLLQRDIDSPTAQPVVGGCVVLNGQTFGETLTCDLNLSPSPGGTLTSVPQGKRLVIEYVSGVVDMPTGTVPLGFFIVTRNGDNQSAGFQFIPTKVGSSGFGDRYIVSQQTRLYSDPGSTVFLFMQPTTSSVIPDLSVTISGYLVNLP